jgi:CIC family chloride channel protein
MIATVIASTITQQVHGSSFFHRQLEKRGLSLSEGQEVSQLRETRVRSIMEEGVRSIAIDAPLAEVRDSLKAAPWGELFVVEADGRLAGMITLNEMGEAAFDRSHDDEWTARDVTRPEPAMLAMDDDLMTAVNLFSASGEAHLPVVRDRKSMALVGLAHEHRVLTSYHQAVIRARAEERGED